MIPTAPLPDPEAYRIARKAVVVIDRSARPRVEVLGPDRAKFLHNLTTADVKALPAGRGREAFITSPQGKTIGYVDLIALDDRTLIRTAAGLDLWLPHLRKYGVFDDVEILDVTATTFELHMLGPLSGELAASLGLTIPGTADLEHLPGDVAGKPVLVIRDSPAGVPGFTLVGAAEDAEVVFEAIDLAGAEPLDGPSFEALRIEAGMPEFGKDVSAENLPQEVGRDKKAISFTKGCYLGQETVARLDALGHVNKLLVGGILDADGPPPPPGTPLLLDLKAIGMVTSSSHSPRFGRPVVLGYARVAGAKPGTTLVVGEGGPTLIVVDLPMP